MSEQPPPAEQGADMPGNMANNLPTPEQQTQDPLAAPAVVFLLINSSKNHEEEMSKTHTAMLELWEQEKATEAEELALLLLSYSELPIPYRAFTHMASPPPSKSSSQKLMTRQVLAYGQSQPFFHAQMMVGAAQEGIAKWGPDGPTGLAMLLLAEETLAEVEADLADAKGGAEGGEKDVDEGPMVSKDKDAEGTKDEGLEDQ
jgi:hypothetical protein